MITPNLSLIRWPDAPSGTALMYIHRFTPFSNALPAPDEKTPVNDRLRYYRTQSGLTQSEAAILIGIDRTTYIRWEGQPLKYYPRDKLTRAAEVFGCKVEDITDRYNLFLLSAPANLKTLRKEMSITQRELARALGVSTGTVKEWEQGVKRMQEKSYERLMILTQPK